MPKPSLHALTWSEKRQCYELTTSGQFQQAFRQEDESVWLAWVQVNTAFAFEGRGGHLSVIKEARPRGAGYWYAYSRQARRTRKRYIGRTTSFAHLEQIASELTGEKRNIPKLVARTTHVVTGKPQRSFHSTSSHDSISLLATKLSPPQLPALLVTRERLLKDLDAVSSHRLVLLSAAAGSGKTTLLSAWVARFQASAHAVSWLSLEEQDNDPLRFWNYVVAALRTSEPTVGETALNMLQAPQPPPLTAILTTLINDLATDQKDILLVFDDYHVINDPIIVSSVQFFLEHLPSRLHLILSGRTEPQLALPRLRARGQVIELRGHDLRFTRAETTLFFAQAMEHPPTEAEIDVLEQRVEGWIAGLQLAAIAMRTRADYSAFVQQLNGSQRFILDYMQEEIFASLPQEVQDFLLHTAILPRLHASLCQAVTKGASVQASQQMLLTLERANLFLVPLDEERRWYRLHSLFRDVLLARLQAISPERIPILHQRAAHWYVREGNTRQAILHALEGNDYAFAADLMEQSADYMCFNGEVSQLHAWIKCLPDTLLFTHADLALTTSLQILLQTLYNPDEQWNQAIAGTEQIFARLEAHLQDRRTTLLSAREIHLLQNRLSLLRGWIASRTAILQENAEQMRLIGIRLQKLAREDNVVWKMLPTYHLIAGETNTVALLPMLSELKEQAEKEQHPYEAIWMMERLGVVYRDMGQPHPAYQIMREALQQLQQMGKARSLFGYIHLQLAEFHWTWNQLEEARTHLDAALQFARNWQHTDIQVAGCYQSLRLFLARGQWGEAEQALEEAQRLSQQSQWKHHRRLVMAGQAMNWLAQGNLAAASAWATNNEVNPQVSSRIDDEEYAEALALVRVFLALRRYNEALCLLTHLLTHAEQNENAWHMAPVLALQAAALHLCGEHAQGRQVAQRLLQLAKPADFLRVYLDAGTPLRQIFQGLLDETHTQPEHDKDQVLQASIRTVLIAFEQNAHNGQPSPMQRQTVFPPLLSPLTAREQEVLSLLAQGKTNQEIANHLVVSLATAKKHIGNILSKLGVGNRVQAIAQAREYELL